MNLFKIKFSKYTSAYFHIEMSKWDWIRQLDSSKLIKISFLNSNNNLEKINDLFPLNF